jgi:hypothetical protein
MVKSFKNYWTALPNLKPNIENPVFAMENLSSEKKKSMGSSLCPLIYLSRENAIEEYNPVTVMKRTIFEGEYLKANSKNLLCLSKRESTLILIFRNPFKILHIDLTDNTSKLSPEVTTHDPLI